MKSLILPALMLLLFLSSCAPTYRPFTENLHQSFRWSESDLKKVQFYLSEDIILHRELAYGETAIEGGKIITEKGRRIEEIVFEEGTPGVLVFMPKENRMAVSFEDGGDRFLMFGPNPKANDRYVLLASNWTKRSGQVSYNGKQYRTSTNSAFAGLLVDMDRVDRTEVKRRRAKGRTI